MEKTALLEYLSGAKRHARRSKANVKAQKRLIAAQLAVGQDPTEAEKILETFEKRQTDDLSEMQQILNALDTMQRE